MILNIFLIDEIPSEYKIRSYHNILQKKVCGLMEKYLSILKYVLIINHGHRERSPIY